MPEHILVPYDDSPLARKALEHALRNNPDADVTVFYVMNPFGAVLVAEGRGLPAVSEWEAQVEALADEVTAAATDLAARKGRDVTTVSEYGTPARAVLDYVQAHVVDHVVMGSHSREGISHLVLGSAAEQVVRQAPVPVTVVR